MTYSHRIELGLGLSLMMTSLHILNILMTTQKRTSEDDNQSLTLIPHTVLSCSDCFPIPVVKVL